MQWLTGQEIEGLTKARLGKMDETAQQAAAGAARTIAALEQHVRQLTEVGITW